MEIILAFLYFHVLEMHAPCIDADGCSGLHSVGSDAMASDGFGQMIGGRFGASSTSQHLAAYVHQSVEECACGQDDTLRLEGHSPTSGDTCYFAVLYQEFFHGVLPYVKIGNVL